MRRPFIGLLAAASFALVGCASVPEGAAEAEALECPPGEEGCDDILPVGPGGAITAELGNFYIDVTDGVAVTGDLEVTVENPSDALHNFEVLGAADGSDIPEAGPGGTDTGTVLVFPGEWTVICNVPGHRAAGMETTMTVYATEEEAQEAAEDGATEEGSDAAEGDAAA